MAKEAKKSGGKGSVAAARELRNSTAPAEGSGRWATIVKIDDPKDAREVVANISQMNPPGIPPEVEPDEENEGNYSVEEVAGGVLIGMRRGGKWLPEGYAKVEGFGWRDEADYVAAGSPVGVGATRLKDLDKKEAA
jgi:hypothetical protein